MTMQGIDISSWQAGIDLSVVPCDFAIIKATQGTGYTNPDCVRAVEQCLSLNKPFGIYHYVSGGNAVAEANFFVDSILNWIGKGILVVDWESNQNSAWGNTSYLDALVKRIIARTGIKLGFADLFSDADTVQKRVVAAFLEQEEIVAGQFTEAQIIAVYQPENFYLSKEGYTFFLQGNDLPALHTPVEVTLSYDALKDVSLHG